MISYVRLLLNDSMLKAHQHGLHITCECECGQGIEDTYHFLHECTSYVDIRQALFDEVKNVWKDSSNEVRPTLSVPLLLAPYSGFQLTTPQCHQIVSATFEYIKILHVVCNMTTELCQPSTSVAQLCMDLQCV